MIWFILVAFITVTFGVYTAVDSRDWEEGFICGGFALIIGGMLALILMLTVGYIAYDKEYYSYTFDVMAAKDGSSVQGQFGIFGGYIDEEAYYFFYRKYEDGRIEQGKIRADRTSIYQDQETRAFIEVTKTEDGLKFWGLPPGDEPRYEIHVPDGSVIQDVEFDLE